MKIQSLSVVVPNRNCVNKCKFCVSRMRLDNYKNYVKRLEFARDNGCNTVMLTGDSEPQQNRSFLQRFGTMNNNLPKPFRWVEMQTTGVFLDDPYLRFLRNHVGISTISLSLSSFSNDHNATINGTPKWIKIDIKSLCESIKKYDFNLRLSLNMNNFLLDHDPETLFNVYTKRLGADQVTLRVLYSSGTDTDQDQWIQENGYDEIKIKEYRDYILQNGKALERLEFGAIKYSLNGMSVVLDDDCMSTDVKPELKYLILRPNCKLYSKWDNPASLIF